MLKISNVSFSYHQDVFSQINLTLPSQGIIVIIGDNGAGKSTLLKLLSGQLRPDDGSIKVDGEIGSLPQTSDVMQQSGGEYTRNTLERLLAMNYDVLLLDEPTNNLDEAGISWLVTRLRNYHGLVLVASHDRDFIDQIAERIVELKDGKLYEYVGNYTDYLSRQRQSRNEMAMQYQKAEKAKVKIKKQIVEARSNVKTKNRRFDKTKDEDRMTFNAKRSNAETIAGRLIKNATARLVRFDNVHKPEVRKVYCANIQTDSSKRRRLLLLDEVTKSYGTRKVLNDISLEVYSGEKYHVLGDNGAGKTTLFQIIMGRVRPDSGVIQLADNTTVGYIAQDVYGLDLRRSFLEQIEISPTEIFKVAMTMDLGTNELRKPLAQLSRGQLTKMAFLKIMLAPVDLLILDEPTNHLDIRARENIEKALIRYPGALLLASHDKAFVRALGEIKQIRL